MVITTYGSVITFFLMSSSGSPNPNFFMASASLPLRSELGGEDELYKELRSQNSLNHSVRTHFMGLVLLFGTAFKLRDFRQFLLNWGHVDLASNKYLKKLSPCNIELPHSEAGQCSKYISGGGDI